MQQAQDRQDVRQGRRLQLSLPQGFSFNYTDSGPKTPEPREPASSDAKTTQPPNLPKVRIHRRKPFPAAPLGPVDFDASSDLQVPTIQLPELSSDFGPVLSFGGSELEDGLLAAPTSRTARSYKRYGRIISPPKTPLDQIFNSFDAAFGATTQVPVLTPQQTLESSIPHSPADFSDSEDSDDSSDSGPSWEEDLGSPDAELPDAFSQLHDAAGGLSSPMNFRESRPASFRSSVHLDKQKWTPEMDEHLWASYVKYLADPVHTPFKMLPGTAPPLGVCHRVAREAKKTWKGPSHSPVSPGAASADFMNVDNNTTTTEQSYLMPRFQQQYNRSTSDMSRKSNSKWLRSEGATRRRLRHLCKRNPTLAAHYHRLVQTRTPSPFESSSSAKAGSSSRFASPAPADTDSAFATRDLNITLATSTAASMQPDAPLAQLAQDLPVKPRPYSTEYSRPARRGVHHRSQSLQLGLGLHSQPVDASKFRDLASPFHESQQPDWLTTAPAAITTAPTTQHMASVKEDITEEGASIKIHAPRPLSGTLKRRSELPTGADELVTGDSEKRRSMIQNLFRSSIDEGDTRFHGRASTIGAIRHSTCGRHLADIFTPPTIAEQAEPLPSPIGTSHTRQASLADQMSSYRLPAPPQLEEIPRLASPFAPAPNARFSRTFPRTSHHPGYHGLSHSQQTSTNRNRQTWDGTHSPHSRLH